MIYLWIIVGWFIGILLGYLSSALLFWLINTTNKRRKCPATSESPTSLSSQTPTAPSVTISITPRSPVESLPKTKPT